MSISKVIFGQTGINDVIIDLEGKYIGAILNPGFSRHEELKMNLDSEYFNSGVMLINNKLCKTDNIMKKVIDFIDENHEIIMFPDQDGLNAIVNGNWQKIPLKFNQLAVIYEKKNNVLLDSFSQIEIEEAKTNPIIIHYTGSDKPWHLGNKHPYKNLYWKYLKTTPFKQYIPSNISFKNFIKFLLTRNQVIKLKYLNKE